jgi:hypothetical protein
VSGFRVASTMARTLPATIGASIRGGVRIVAALTGAAAWLVTRGVPPAARFGSELLRRPVDWIFYLLLAIASVCAHVLMASLGFWRFAAAELAIARWLLVVQAVAWGLAIWAGYGVLVGVAVWAWLAIGAVIGLAFEYRSYKARTPGGKGEPDGDGYGPWPPGLGPPGR